MTHFKDPSLSTVYCLASWAWPDGCRDVWRIARKYWDTRDEISINDSLLLKGVRIVIPAVQQTLCTGPSKRPLRDIKVANDIYRNSLQNQEIPLRSLCCQGNTKGTIYRQWSTICQHRIFTVHLPIWI